MTMAIYGPLNWFISGGATTILRLGGHRGRERNERKKNLCPPEGGHKNTCPLLQGTRICVYNQYLSGACSVADPPLGLLGMHPPPHQMGSGIKIPTRWGFCACASLPGGWSSPKNDGDGISNNIPFIGPLHWRRRKIDVHPEGGPKIFLLA